MNARELIEGISKEIEIVKFWEKDARSKKEKAQHTGRIFGLQYARNLARSLKELQQPVIPQYVADLVDWTVKCNSAPSDVIREFQTNTPDTVNLPETLELEKLDEYFEKAYCRYDFEKACFVGYVVEVPIWYVKIGKGYFAGFEDTKATVVFEDAPEALESRIPYKDEEEAKEIAEQIGGEVENG